MPSLFLQNRQQVAIKGKIHRQSQRRCRKVEEQIQLQHQLKRNQIQTGISGSTNTIKKSQIQTNYTNYIKSDSQETHHLLLAPLGALKMAPGRYPIPIPHIALSVQYLSIMIKKGYKDKGIKTDTKTDKKAIKW